MVLKKIPTFGEIKNWVNNNADVPNADYSDNAGDADTVDGLHASDLNDNPMYATQYMEGGGRFNHNRTKFVDGALEIIDNDSSQISHTTNESNSSDGYEVGLILTFPEGADAIETGVNGNNIGEVRLQNYTTNTHIETKTGSDLSGSTLRFEHSFNDTDEYNLWINDGSFGWHYYSDPNWPITSQYVEAPTGTFQRSYSNSQYRVFSPITVEATPMTGNTVVSWNKPEYLEEWNQIAFANSNNGGSVTVDVEDETGTVLHSDIGNNFDVSSIGTGTNFRLRAKLSRSGSTENPSFDYGARRYIGGPGSPALVTENGGFYETGNSRGDKSISFNHTYDSALFMPSVNGTSGEVQDSYHTSARVKSLTTDSNGDITGMTVEFAASDYSANFNWYVMGATV